ncbi:hypothetical protein V1514DRAFT_326612 [Lipomyces japonicus]|uniref:uncharacterized protein n=1 Tax=Lipomyces japonicus TaxID=56871 RepID=UPI0034CDB821
MDPAIARIVDNDLVLRTLTPYLSAHDLFSLAATCSSFRRILLGAGSEPDTAVTRWHCPVHELDLTGCSSRAVTRVLAVPVFKKSLRLLFLDGCFVGDDMLQTLFTDFRLRYLSLSASYGWSLERLCQLIEKLYFVPLDTVLPTPTCLTLSPLKLPVASLATSRASSLASRRSSFASFTDDTSSDDYSDSEIMEIDENDDDDEYVMPDYCYYEPRPVPSIRRLGLIGGPTFPTACPSTTAPLFVNIASRAGIQTDLVACQAHPPQTTVSADGWFLAEPKSRRCHACQSASEKLCLRCQVLRSCRSCGKFWCRGCDPHGTRTQLDCYDCGPTCLDCKQGKVSFCKFCKAKYCRLHQESSTESYCDWCSSRGGKVRRSLY